MRPEYAPGPQVGKFDPVKGRVTVVLLLTVSFYGLALGVVAGLLPGAPPVLHRGADSLQPFKIVEELLNGKLADRAWQERAAALGIATLRLSVS